MWLEFGFTPGVDHRLRDGLAALLVRPLLALLDLQSCYLPRIFSPATSRHRFFSAASSLFPRQAVKPPAAVLAAMVMVVAVALETFLHVVDFFEATSFQ